MAILTVDDLKGPLRIDLPTDVDDAFIARLIDTGTALVEAHIGGTPIERRPMTDEIEPGPSVDPVTLTVTDRGQLKFRLRPMDPTTLSVVDPDGVVVDPSAYTVHGPSGVITAFADAFAPGPHTVTADVGLDLASDYLLADLPVMQAAVQDFVAWFFEQRNPAAEYEASGAGVATTFNKSADAGLPARIRNALDVWMASKRVQPRRRPIPSRV